MSQHFSFPVERIFYKVQEDLPKAFTVGLSDGFEKGLRHEINLVDRDGCITTVAEVSPSGQVSLSVAYCQFLLLICHIGYIIHESIAVDSALERMSDDEKEEYYKELEIDCQLTRFLREIPSFEKAKEYCSRLIDTAKPLLQHRPLSVEEFEALCRDVSYDSELAGRANSLCVYGIIFTLLHEASHVILGQNLRERGSVQEEIEADNNAFWALWGDLEGKERNTAMMGCLCSLASLLFLNPTLEPDENDPHPREDSRLFSFYDILKDEKTSYTEMLVFLLITWATVVGEENFPILSVSYQHTLESQRAYLSRIGNDD